MSQMNLRGFGARAFKMPQWVKGPMHKTDNPSSTPRTDLI